MPFSPFLDKFGNTIQIVSTTYWQKYSTNLITLAQGKAGNAI
jgi:hypothetical protein